MKRPDWLHRDAYEWAAFVAAIIGACAGFAGLVFGGSPA